MNRLILNGMLRRKKEIIPPFIVTLIAVIFLTGVTLMQEMLNSYLHKSNMENFGDWVVASVDEELTHPYFAENCYITTGEFLVGNDGYRKGLLMGTIGGDFDAIGGNYMQDGRMPQKDNEIVTNTAVLSAYGYSYELGQIITIRYHNEDMEVMEKDYVLVGVIKAFDGIWKNINNATMPDCYFTQHEFDSYEKIVNTVYYYRLNPMYGDVDTWELSQSFKTEDNNIIHNDYVYANGVWGSKEMYIGVTLAIGIVATLTIGYLLVIYIHKRRPVYFKYRSIGASKLQVRGLATLECITITLPAIVGGIGVSYLVAIIVSKVISSVGDVGSFFEFKFSLLMLQIAFAVLVVIIGIIVVQFSVGDKKISQNTSEIKHSNFKRLRKYALRTRNPQKTFLKRRSIVNPLQNIMFAGVSAIMFGCMLYCVNCMWEVYVNYNFYNDWSDFKMVLKTDYEYTETSSGVEVKHSGEKEYLGVGIEKPDINQIRDINGVKTVDYAIKDQFHYFKWDGMENSDNYKTLIETFDVNHPLESYMEGRYLTEFDDLEKEVKNRGDSQKINWDLIEKGEQAVLFVNLYYDDIFSGDTATSVVSEENTIKAGDSIKICHAITGVETEVLVGAVYFFNKPSVNSEFSTHSYMLVGSVALAEKIAGNENVDIKYNYISISYNSFSSYQATDKQLALFAYERGMEYGSNAELLRTQSMDRIQKTTIYGSLFVVMAVAYIAIYANVFESKKVYLEKQLRTLKQIGMSNAQYIRMFYSNECKILLGGFVGIILFYLFMGYGIYIEYSKFSANNTLGFSTIINAFTDDPFLLTAGALINGMQHGLYIVTIIIMYLLMIGGSFIAIKKSVHKEER